MSTSPGWTGAHFSVVVDEFDIFSTSFCPSETNPPLIVHADTVLTHSIPLQLLQPVSRWYTQRFEEPGRVDLRQLPEGDLLYTGIDRRHPVPLPQSLGRPVSEGSDHETSL
ncbi:hypothetical protein [Arthrobacter terrae]|uniref:hypothetical protein n=1 Tax=Arthrobacter terrae TaxID=2935737 RepID=UPI00406BBDA4